MAQRLAQKPKVDFSAGLVTETHPLNFVENGSIDELNMDMLRDGSRRRRKAISYETAYEDVFVGLTEGMITHVHKWVNVGSVTGLVFTVLQVGPTLHFFEVSSDTLSANKKAFTVDLTAYNAPLSNGAAFYKINATSIKGRLIVVSSGINSIEVRYDSVTDTISVQEITFRIRDFEWQGDRTTYGVAIDLADPSLVGNDDRRYDQRNAGWRAYPLSVFVADVGAYPRLTHPWYSGKNSSGDFETGEWQKIYAGSSIINIGSYILDLYNQDRATVSGFPLARNYTERTRFSSVTAFAGRVFYSGMTSEKYTNTVFFSQILDDLNNVGELLQKNDPTSEELSDVLPDDGGFISIDGAYNIQRLHVLGGALLVFAENGVWQVRGIDSIFKATDYTVTKVSSAGLKYEGSFVSAQGRPYWWSASGIYAIRASEEQQVLTGVNISIDRVQSFYEEITERNSCRGIYDATTSKVFWCYSSTNESTEGKLNEILVFDERRTAFIPWTVSGDTSYILDGISLEDDASISVDYNVVDNVGNFVVDSSGDNVIATRAGRQYYSSTIKFVTVTPTGGITFSEFTGRDFLDWGTEDYSSYLIGSYDFLESLTLKKSGGYVTPFFTVTETAIVDDNGSLVFDYPSSCLVSSLWDFKTSANTVGEQAYKIREMPIPSSVGSFEYPKNVLKTRRKVRGRGVEVHFKFESEPGHDFHLLGYNYDYKGNTSL